MTEPTLPGTDLGDTTDQRRVVPDDLYDDEKPAGMIVKPTKFARDLTRSIKADLKKLADLNRRSLDLTCDVGDKLIKLKTEIGHGGWGWWIDTNFGLTDRTARHYMDLAANRKRVSELPPETSLRGAISTLRAERRAIRRAAEHQRAQSFSPAQLEKRTQAQRLNATRRVWEQMADLANSEMADPSLAAQELWPDESERARQVAGMIGVYKLAHTFLTSLGIDLSVS